MKKRFLLIAALAAFVFSCAPLSPANDKASAEEGAEQAVTPDFEEKECDIENPGTRKFLEEVDYSDDPEYTISYAADYYSDYKANDKPLPVKFTWRGIASRIMMSTSPQMENAFNVKPSSGEAAVYNLVPGVKYYYKVLDSKGVELKNGIVTPVGPLRMINGISDNVRDLGGWKADGGHIAYGRLFRGSQLSSRISQDGKDIFLKDLGISVDLDLRGIKDSEASAGPVITEALYLKLPVEKNLGRGTGNTEELYQKAIRYIIGWLGQGRNIYFHCAGGADRTGSLAFLIEALLGVSESDLSKDYEITTFAGANTRLRNFRATESETHILFELVTRVREFGDPGTQSINQLVYNWATTSHSPDVDPLTDQEIALLRQYLIQKD